MTETNKTAPQDSDLPIPFGISARTGTPLEGFTHHSLEQMVVNGGVPAKLDRTFQNKVQSAEKAFGVVGGTDACDLKKQGWGILYANSVRQEIKDALRPLLDWRQTQVKDGPFKVFEGERGGYQPKEDAASWLDRQGGVSLDIVDPAEDGVPYYLMIVGSPEEIPFEFQYELDIFWAVGRLWFETKEEFSRYVESVIDYERKEAITNSKQIAIFATEHDFDNATQLFTKEVVVPLTAGTANTSPLGLEQGFKQLRLLGKASTENLAATKENLSELLSGNLSRGTPAVIFSGTHGMEFGLNDNRQKDCQGALVCQDWNGYGSIESKDWFSAADIPKNAKLSGLIHFLFACHGAGYPQFDDFDRLNAHPRKIAAEAQLSSLPQRLLSHPLGGALAVLGHVERAWAYSFQSGSGRSQIQGFRDVLGRLLLGDRIGNATDAFNSRWAALSTKLTRVLGEMQEPSQNSKNALANLWVSRDDARNYIIFGDPAVRLRVADMV